jgi:hypothetical protein
MATAAAAAVARARRRVISHFMQHNAVSAASAVRWVPDRRLQRRVLASCVRRGILVETARDTYFLDVPAYDRWHRARHKRVAILMVSIAVIAALVVIGAAFFRAAHP